MRRPGCDGGRDTIVAPKTETLDVTSPAFRHTFPGNSVAVLRLK
jgi:hypothetical protein